MQSTTRKKYTKVNNKSTRKKSNKPLPSKEEIQVEKIVSRLRKKIYKDIDLSSSDKAFAKWYIKSFISDNVLSGKGDLKYKRTWNIRTYSALEDFKRSFKSDFIKELSNEERTIFVLKSIFKLSQSLVKDAGNFDSLSEEVSLYYRECFMTNKTDKKVLFKSGKIKITVSFNKNTITLKDRVNNKTYVRDIILEELNIFPNPRLASQYIK